MNQSKLHLKGQIFSAEIVKTKQIRNIIENKREISIFIFEVFIKRLQIAQRDKRNICGSLRRYW